MGFVKRTQRTGVPDDGKARPKRSQGGLRCLGAPQPVNLAGFGSFVPALGVVRLGSGRKHEISSHRTLVSSVWHHASRSALVTCGIVYVCRNECMYKSVYIYIYVLTSVNPCAQQSEKLVHPALQYFLLCFWQQKFLSDRPLGEGTRDLCVYACMSVLI